jgi:hypothetical protein
MRARAARGVWEPQRRNGQSFRRKQRRRRRYSVRPWCHKQIVGRCAWPDALIAAVWPRPGYLSRATIACEARLVRSWLSALSVADLVLAVLPWPGVASAKMM